MPLLARRLRLFDIGVAAADAPQTLGGSRIAQALRVDSATLLDGDERGQFLDWLLFFVSPYGLSTTAYVVVQLVAIVRTSGWTRVVCLLPLPLMAVLLIQSFHAYQGDSNLWPVLLIFAAPVALMYVTATWLVAEGRRLRAARGRHDR